MFRELGRVVLLVEDQTEALAFYRNALGFETLHDERVDGFRYLHIGLPGQHRMGIWLMPPMSDEERGLIGRQAGSQPFLVLYTDNLEKIRQRLVAQGVDVWAERTDDSSRSLHFHDIAGNVLVAVELLQNSQRTGASEQSLAACSGAEA